MLKRALIILCMSVLTFTAYAKDTNSQTALSFDEISRWPEPVRPTFKTVVGMNENKVAIQGGSFMLIRAYAGDACPAGQYFLANLETRTITSVEIGTCDDTELTFGVNKAKGTTNNKSFDVYSHGDLSARIPIY